MFQIPSSKRGDPWFEDGNIILVADGEDESNSIAFKVHRGVLARHSEVFESMLVVAQPPPDTETVEQCSVLRMHDIPIELSNLVKALYDGPVHLVANQLPGVENFLYIAGILKLSTKYCIPTMRTRAIRHLADTWTHTLQGHDRMIEQALSADQVNGISYPYVHPLHVLNLARATDVRLIIPSVHYFLSMYPLDQLLKCDHPKLDINHPSRPSSNLTVEDLQAYTLMYQWRLQVIMDFVRRQCGEFTSDSCSNSTKCPRIFARLSNRLAREWNIRTGPLHFMVQAEMELATFPDVCKECRTAFKKAVSEARAKAWEELPTVIGFPGWKELEAADLSQS